MDLAVRHVSAQTTLHAAGALQPLSGCLLSLSSIFVVMAGRFVMALQGL
jgi:hypothetical protein